MRKRIKRVFVLFYGKSRDYVEIIFKSPADNQMRIQKEQFGRFGSYIQLKKYQKHIRRLAFRIFLAILFLFIGILVGPAVFVPEKKAEIFIPNGRGDILISNVSKSQASVIFKTLDSANQNKPLATVSVVEIFEDENFEKIVKKTDVQDYAVTHIVPIEGLKGGKIYYIRILASETKDMDNSKTVSAWGGKEPIKIYASGDIIPTCFVEKTISAESSSDYLQNKKDSVKEIQVESIEFAKSPEEENDFLSKKEDDNSLKILAVQNENYLHGREKVQTIISWETNFPSSSALIYRESDKEEEKEIKIDNEDMKKHAIVLMTLKTGTAYYFKVKSEDKKGNIAVSEEYSLRTPHPKDTVIEMVGNNFKELVRQMGF